MVDPYVTAAQKRIQSRERMAGMSPQQLEQMRAQGIQQVQQDFGDTSQGIYDFAQYPVSYTHLTLPTNREV